MTIRKSTKGQTTIYKTHTHKTKDRVTGTPQKTGGEHIYQRIYQI